jgi:hypothetical protein
MFSGLFSAMQTAIALKLCTWLYVYDLQIKYEDVCWIYTKLWEVVSNSKNMDGIKHGKDCSSEKSV